MKALLGLFLSFSVMAGVEKGVDGKGRPCQLTTTSKGLELKAPGFQCGLTLKHAGYSGYADENNPGMYRYDSFIFGNIEATFAYLPAQEKKELYQCFEDTNSSSGFDGELIHPKCLKNLKMGQAYGVGEFVPDSCRFYTVSTAQGKIRFISYFEKTGWLGGVQNVCRF